mgnify:CR=1 FL=1
MTYQERIDFLKESLGAEVEDENGVVWTIVDYNIRRIYDPLVALWNRDTYEQKYVGREEFMQMTSVSTEK